MPVYNTDGTGISKMRVLVRNRTLFCALLCLFLSASRAARGDTVTYTFNTGTVNIHDFYSTTLEVPEFNPSLGTLNSVTVSLSADASLKVQATASGAGITTLVVSLADAVDVDIDGSPLINTTCSGNGYNLAVAAGAFSATADGTGTPGPKILTGSSELAPFKGTGDANLSLDIAGVPSWFTDPTVPSHVTSDTASADFTVTYDYTTVPLPSAAMGGMGLMCALAGMKVIIGMREKVRA